MLSIQQCQFQNNVCTVKPDQVGQEKVVFEKSWSLNNILYMTKLRGAWRLSEYRMWPQGQVLLLLPYINVMISRSG